MVRAGSVLALYGTQNALTALKFATSWAPCARSYTRHSPAQADFSGQFEDRAK
ncbi:hypothetical protein R2601_20716 [Salipiger bermudensis HTCC2601]|uniref:Uncharacterized protein n=1 Tax=Salipiger bermudensis (strain DSM 26914 / JCM 13377 / KCTC 12554 / HTCC2601) TaxID=314265 RepID=Q0FNN6_SALBH|nr:hypothetical protein R2601_20716 [Salipiger bermudensis HTCC2601]